MQSCAPRVWMATQQAKVTESLDRELGVLLDATALQAGASAVLGIIGRQKIRGMDLSCSWLQAGVQGKKVTLKNGAGGKQHGSSRDKGGVEKEGLHSKSLAFCAPCVG